MFAVPVAAIMSVLVTMVSTAASAYASIYAAKQQSAMQEKQLRANLAIAQMEQDSTRFEAQQAISEAAQEKSAYQRAQAARNGEQKTALAAANLNLNSGTPLHLMEDNALETQLGLAKIDNASAARQNQYGLAIAKNQANQSLLTARNSYQRRMNNLAMWQGIGSSAAGAYLR